jgi:hypothetical protein
VTQPQQTPFDAFAAPLVGLPVSHVWRGHGSAIFLEFGALKPTTRRDGSPSHRTGEMGLMIEWSWRIEGKRSILCGSWTDERRWPTALACLTRTTVTKVTLFGRLPELDLAFASGLHLVSLMTGRGDPAWALFDRRAGCRWAHVRHGLLRIEEAAGD